MTDHDHDHDHHPTLDAAALHPIVDGVHAWIQPDGSWWVNNTGAITGTGRTLIVDTCATEQRTRRFLDAVAEVTSSEPIAFAVNTHAHGDHTYGNCLLPASTTLIGHAHMRRALLDDPVIDGCPPNWDPVPNWGPVTRRAPDVAVLGDTVVHLGHRRIELHHPGFTAHTDGDLVAWLPDERVLFTGDLIFHGLTPLAFQGSIEGARRSLEWIASFEPEHVVPGHGPLLERSGLDAVLDEHDRYYRLVLAASDLGRRNGRSELEAARDCDLGDFAHWADPERLVLNLHRAYAEAAGTDVDFRKAFLDAKEWNGGPLTTHVCCIGRSGS